MSDWARAQDEDDDEEEDFKPEVRRLTRVAACRLQATTPRNSVTQL